jgi:predicted glycogen debranching enzyme
VRPFFSGRDYHALHHRNDAFRFVPHSHGARTTFSPYVGVPSIVIESNGRYFHQPDWYLNFSYRQEEERGLDSVEDLAAPGEWHFALVPGRPAFMMLSAQSVQPSATDRQRTRDAWAASNAVETVDGPGPDDVRRRAECIMERERERRARLDDPLHAAADAYVVRRGQGKTIVAGYPWFTDWGRDTFIAVRGLCLIGDRAADARDMLVEWSGAVSEGMLPNRFPDSGEQPEYNSVDASLWFVVAAAELLDLHERGGVDISDAGRRAITRAIEQIVAGYTSGTRYGIRADSDGLLRCGVANSQLTWMDARVDGRSITPRVGKPVEVQALWINALAAAERLGLPTTVSVRDATRVFADRFWYEESGSLADVVDVDHVAGTRDMTCRPNQILAVGGLPVPLLDERQAAAVVRTVERRLLTPVGLRSLAPDEPGYVGIYAGGAAARDGAYHQGTVWPWLIGAFVDAWLRVHGRTKEATRDARRRFFAPLSDHLHTAGLGHVSEIADGDAPHMARGCPFQAWSLGELMRVDRLTREGEIA